MKRNWSAGLLAVWTVMACEAANYAVYVVTPPITDEMILRDGGLPAVCKKSNSIKLSGCGGQYAPASFVVETSRPLEAVDVDVEVDPLSGPGGSWPREAVDVRVVKEYYRPPSAMPRLLVHDETFLAIEPAPTPANPKAMKNVARAGLRDTATLQPVRIEGRKQFWITVQIPPNATAGIYKTSVRIIPGNDASSELALEVEVYPFELLPPMLEYSIYYPVSLDANLTAAQYAAELRNMLAHGIGNPNIYNAVSVRGDGTVDFTVLEKILELRESVGMRPDTLYLVGHPVLYEDRPLAADQREKSHRYVRDINTWAARRGYPKVFFMGGDEWFGEKLSRERDSMLSVHEAGGRTFVAVAMNRDFLERVGEVLHRPVFELGKPQLQMGRFMNEQKHYEPAEVPRHMAEIGQIGVAALERLATDPETRQMIDGVNRLGHRLFSYTTGVNSLPQFQRRSEGLGLWRLGFGGTMNWAYTHNTVLSDRVDQELVCAVVYRTDDGVLDTLRWEGVRAGVDDVRYLTTLLDTLNRVRGRHPEDPLVRETEQWVNGLDVFHGDLDALRQEMARRIVALLNLGARPISPEQALAGIDMKRVQVITLSKPWRWKMDVEDHGVREKWFGPAFDDRGWETLPTDSQDKGWGTSTGFGWYRNELPLTKQDAKKKYTALYFGACDEDAWVYLNGHKVFNHSYEATGLLPEEIWQRPFVVPLTRVKLRGGDLLAVRVYNSAGMGGVWKPVHLILSDQKLTESQVQALMKRR